MKRIFLLLIIILPLSIVGCSLEDSYPISYKEKTNNTNKSVEKLDYKIENISLSQGYQNIEPGVEIINKDFTSKLLVSVGLVNSSGIDISEINRFEDQINIHIKNKGGFLKSQVVTPQILLELKDIDYKELENYKINIVNKNYSPIDIKFGVNEIIEKINSQFNISVVNFPSVNIINKSGEILWDISYENIFDKSNITSPVINLSVLVDADKGKVVESSKDLISSFIDEGEILYSIPNHLLIYKKIDYASKEGKGLNSNLWTFNINNGEREKIYKSKSDIQSVFPNSKFSNLAVLESTSENNEIYIIETKTNKAYKASINKNINPSLIQWKNNKELYIVDSREESSNIYIYNTKDNNYDFLFKLDKNIVDLKVENDVLILTEKENHSDNLKIHLQDNVGKFKSKFSDYGFQPYYINNSLISYLKSNENDNSNSLNIYDIEKEKIYDSIDLNISNYFPIDNDEIILIEKNDSDNKYTLYQYKLEEKSYQAITSIKSDSVFYNKDKDLLYVDHTIPFESKRSQIIYSIDLSKINN